MAGTSIKERYEKVLGYFDKEMPDAETELEYAEPFQLIVAVILSAQCTDKRVNMITPAFFRKFPDAASLAGARQEEVLDLIRSCSYPNNKSRHLIGMARMLVNDFGSKVPAEVEQLRKLPGVGRKTANVVASVVHNLPVMPVDTHVFRVAARLGLTRGAKTPLQAELQLVRHIPEHMIPKAHHWLILHGRYTCTARKPSCGTCGLKNICPYHEKNKLNTESQ